jgi:hypothetical protein
MASGNGRITRPDEGAASLSGGFVDQAAPGFM